MFQGSSDCSLSQQRAALREEPSCSTQNRATSDPLPQLVQPHHLKRTPLMLPPLLKLRRPSQVAASGGESWSGGSSTGQLRAKALVITQAVNVSAPVPRASGTLSQFSSQPGLQARKPRLGHMEELALFSQIMNRRSKTQSLRSVWPRGPVKAG